MPNWPQEGLATLDVLIVEDDSETRELYATILQLSGASVTLAPSADAALELLARRRPHVLLTDLRMPRVGGVELVATLRESESAARLPVLPALALTGDSSNHREDVPPGFQGKLVKPFTPTELVAAIRVVVGWDAP